MHPNAIAVEIESRDVFVSSDQDCWFVVYADAEHSLCVGGNGYQSNIL